MTKSEFAEGIALLTGAVNRPMPDEQLAAWYAMLKDLSPEQLRRGIVETLRTHQFAGYPPIGTILANCGAVIDSKNRPLAAWQAIRAAIQRVGSYESVDFDDPIVNATIRAMGGWVDLCGTPPDEMKWQEKRFCGMYSVLSTSKLPDEQTRRLHGLSEVSNSRQGYDSKGVLVAHVHCLTGPGHFREFIEHKLEAPVRPPACLVNKFARSLATSLDPSRENGGGGILELPETAA